MYSFDNKEKVYYSIDIRNNMMDLAKNSNKYKNNPIVINSDKSDLVQKLDKYANDLEPNEYIKLNIYETTTKEYLGNICEAFKLFATYSIEKNQIDYIKSDFSYIQNECFRTFDITYKREDKDFKFDLGLRNSQDFNIKDVEIFDIARELTILELKMEQGDAVNFKVAYDPTNAFNNNLSSLKNNMYWSKFRLQDNYYDFSKCFPHNYCVEPIINILYVMEKYIEYNNYKAHIEIHFDNKVFYTDDKIENKEKTR